MKLLKQENVQIVDRAVTWEEAICISVEPLEKNGYVRSEYKEEIIKSVKEKGPYIVLSEDIVLPHARPEQGVNQSQIAITLFKKPVRFSEDYASTRLFIALAATNGGEHLKTLSDIAELFQDEEKLQHILQSENEKYLYQQFVL